MNLMIGKNISNQNKEINMKENKCIKEEGKEYR